MLKKIIGMFVIVLILSGCSNLIGKEEFTNALDHLEHSVEQKEWKQLKSQGNDLLNIYDANKWKLQLIGVEQEYEELYETIHKLLVAIEEKDITETKIQLATIKTIITNMYSL